MKTFITKSLLASAIAFAGSSAMADVLPDFTVNPSDTAPISNTFVADKITGNYVERIDFTDATHFNTSIKWQAGQFVSLDGTNPLAAGVTRLGVDYGLYGELKATGTYGPGLAGTTDLVFSSSSLQLYYDKNLDTVLTDPGAGGAANFWGGVQADDRLLATGSLTGALNTSSNGGAIINSCSGFNCGSFGTTDTFFLNTSTGPAPGYGPLFFTAPSPFFNVTLSAGQFNGFSVGAGTSVLTNGSADFVFGRVPEPATLALLGIGLMGLGVNRRK